MADITSLKPFCLMVSPTGDTAGTFGKKGLLEMERVLVKLLEHPRHLAPHPSRTWP